MFGKVLESLFGSKSGRDIKEVRPIVDKVNEHFDALQNISHEELRAKTAEFRQRIADNIADETNQIEDLKSKIDSEENIETKEAYYQQIDDLEEVSYKKTEELLKEIQSEAFAVIKETARRFKESDDIIVPANSYDREVASKSDAVDIDGDNAVWHKEWTAAGNKISWDMLHYDVQLIGGAVLHKGSIAEMATGEGKNSGCNFTYVLKCLAR